MRPDDQYSERQLQLETEKLRQKVSALSLEDKRQVYEKGERVLSVPRRLLGRHLRASARAQPTGSVCVRMCARACSRAITVGVTLLSSVQHGGRPAQEA